jgi:hypothetical protein
MTVTEMRGQARRCEDAGRRPRAHRTDDARSSAHRQMGAQSAAKAGGNAA